MRFIPRDDQKLDAGLARPCNPDQPGRAKRPRPAVRLTCLFGRKRDIFIGYWHAQRGFRFRPNRGRRMDPRLSHISGCQWTHRAGPTYRCSNKMICSPSSQVMCWRLHTCAIGCRYIPHSIQTQGNRGSCNNPSAPTLPSSVRALLWPPRICASRFLRSVAI